MNGYRYFRHDGINQSDYEVRLYDHYRDQCTSDFCAHCASIPNGRFDTKAVGFGLTVVGKTMQEYGKDKYGNAESSTSNNSGRIRW